MVHSLHKVANWNYVFVGDWILYGVLIHTRICTCSYDTMHSPFNQFDHDIFILLVYHGCSIGSSLNLPRRVNDSLVCYPSIPYQISTSIGNSKSKGGDIIYSIWYNTSSRFICHWNGSGRAWSRPSIEGSLLKEIGS